MKQPISAKFQNLFTECTVATLIIQSATKNLKEILFGSISVYRLALPLGKIDHFTRLSRAVKRTLGKVEGYPKFPGKNIPKKNFSGTSRDFFGYILKP